MAPKVAIVLFNLGGPDRPEAIEPFLLNLFKDPAILRVPAPIRPFLARTIARSRLKPATENYALLGGRSPLLELTQRQADALQACFPELDARCFIAMRYWHPMSAEAVQQVKAWKPDHVVLLPLYPQYSTTTTGSSLTAWREAAAAAGLIAPTTVLCCYPTDPAYIAATAQKVRTAYADAAAQLPPPAKLRVLFSAHGLPEAIVLAGDPYQRQIERTVQAIVSDWNGPSPDGAPLDWAICYQSRATPQKWLEPSTEMELERAARDHTAVLVVPIAFVSEHSETLVELDVEYRDLATKLGVPAYFRVPTQNDDPAFIAALADLVRRSLKHGPGLLSHACVRDCEPGLRDCPFTAARAVVTA